MAIWVCRTGAFGEYESAIKNNNQIYLTRTGYTIDLKNSSKEKILQLTQDINGTCSRQTISNIWSQIDIFANRMQIGDLVIIPKKGKYEISIARILTDYTYDVTKEEPLQHQRNVEFLKRGVDTTRFPKDIFYSLGAFRAIFSIKQEDRMLAILRKIGIKI